eukprot:NODE_337_length_9297_cov_0.873994.p10 type:complete len:124 gc:universal NODE_337_length_9297_cov_0.873994:5292-5663(+)
MLDILPSWFQNSDLDIFVKSPGFDNYSYLSCLIVFYILLWIVRALTRHQLLHKSKKLANQKSIKVVETIGGPSDFLYAPVHAIPKHENIPRKGKSNQDAHMEKPELNLENIDRFAIWKSRVPL